MSSCLGRASDNSRQRDHRGVSTPLVTSRDLRLPKYKGSSWVPFRTSFHLDNSFRCCTSLQLFIQLSTLPLHLHSLVTCFLQSSSLFTFTTAIMFATPAGNKLLYTGAAAYATCTAFAAFWVGLRLPIQSNKTGPYNYHKLIKAGRRVPWRRLPRVV